MDIKGIFAWILIIFATISLFAYVIGGIVSSSRKKKSASPDTVSSGETNEPGPKEETSQEGSACTDAGCKPEEAGTQEKKQRITRAPLIFGIILITLQIVEIIYDAAHTDIIPFAASGAYSVSIAYNLGKYFLGILGLILVAIGLHSIKKQKWESKKKY